MFTPSRLSFARRRRGMTKIRLAELINVTSKAVSDWESGEYPPKTEMIEMLSNALKFPTDFFFGSELSEPKIETVSFRSMSKMRSQQRNAALGAGTLAFLLNDWIEKRFDLPSHDLLDLRNETPEMAAISLRQYWGLGERPIKNMVHLLEAKGVRVFSLVEDALEVDAFSTWHEGKPFCFLNTVKSSERSRFDAAHELGHLILHKHAAPSGQKAEKDADAFASSFLMPSSTILAACPKVPTLSNLIKLKQNWIVSVAALAYRLHSVKMLSDWNYRLLCIEIAQKGYRRKEPESSTRETSQIFEKVFQALRKEGITKSSVAKELKIGIDELERLVFGLAIINSYKKNRVLDKYIETGKPDLKRVK
jgi:Zn-dependent peptidase ImmA (M78 family)/DNA-binding XRE family transcriptional regulator